jgi:hypothetical protein
MSTFGGNVSHEDAIYLISCVGEKGTEPTLAKDLYTSSWFGKARPYVEDAGCRWFILSAEHGSVSPDQKLAPYDRSLNTMPINERRKWAERVSGQIDRASPHVNCAVLLAGHRYREFLVGYLRSRSIAVWVPMQGLRIGQQLRWLSKHERAPRRS